MAWATALEAFRASTTRGGPLTALCLPTASVRLPLNLQSKLGAHGSQAQSRGSNTRMTVKCQESRATCQTCTDSVRYQHSLPRPGRERKDSGDPEWRVRHEDKQ